MSEELNLVALRKKPVTTRKRRINRKPSRRDDELWKGILDDVFEDFLRFFFPNADELFNFNKKFVFLDKEFNRLFPPEANAPGIRFVDKLVKVHLKAGGSKFILVHIEVQGNNGHEDLGLRMFRYFYRAKDKHNTSITAFAVLIDDVKSYHPKAYKEEYMGMKLSYEFNTYKILDQDEEELRANPNPFAVVALTVLMALKNRNIEDEDLKRIKIDLTRELIKRNLDKGKRDKIMTFLSYYVSFEKPEMMIKFEEEVEQLKGNVTPMGVIEILMERREKKGIEKGIYQRNLEIALEMKKDKFPAERIAKITGLPIQEIKAL